MSTSKMEEHVARILTESKTHFLREQTFSDLRKGKYRYDFYIPSLEILIECNGEQHYKCIPHFYKMNRDFLAAKERDRRKINYALGTERKLYIIPYWEVYNIHTLSQLFDDRFRATSQWHNDDAWRMHLLSD